jgi:hypothetical protein
MRHFHLVFILLCAAVLTACGSAEPTWSPETEMSRSVYQDDGPTSITLYTVFGKRSGAGAHSGLLINAPSQRAMFDPAGTFKHPHLPERNDVIFGMSDPAVAFYIDYHARVTYDVVEQTIFVSPAVAELALARVRSHGAVAKARCAASIADILRDLPGFETVPNTLFPKKIYKWFDAQGATFKRYEDDSPNENGRLVEAPSLLLQ